VALAAALPAQALENARLASMMARAPTCYSGVGGPDLGEEVPPALIPGLGTPTGLAPDTANAEARKWFEQGMLLVWAYDEAEAIRAFRLAQKLDPKCALCYWGEAHARSPTINLQPPNVDLHAASSAIGAAAALARQPGSKLGPVGRGLIAATRIRAPGSGGSFDFEGYVQAMTALAGEVPDSNAVLVLAADSELVRWSATGVAVQGAQGWLETVLNGSPTHQADPNYSGAIHFYIHLADTLARPELALDHARKLAGLAPAATHLIHMPSHSFYGTGNFRQSVTATRGAIAAYQKYEDYKPAVSGYRRYLYAHDHHYGIQSALMYGDRDSALGLADDFVERFPAQDPLFRIRPAHFAAPWYAYGRHGPVETVLGMDEPMLGYSEASRALSRVMWRYARGEAHARNPLVGAPRAHRGDDTAREAAAIADLLAGPAGRALDPESAALAQMAQHVLEGRAAMLDGRYTDAEAAYRLAMNLRFDANLQFDPPPFWYGVRRSLAASILAQGDATSGAEATELYKRAQRQIDALFATWPEDPLGLYVRSLAKRKLGDPTWDDDLEGAILHWAGGVAIERMPLALI
jgi:tetratricopeptide (TPR) repeat protein